MCETLEAFERQVAKVQLLKLIESQKQQLLKFIEEHNQQMTELELGLLEVYKAEERLVRRAENLQMENDELLAKINQLTEKMDLKKGSR